MNVNERINLQKMIDENNVDDFTNDIREKKHSDKIKKDVDKLLDIMRNDNLSENELDELCVKNCIFLFNNYTDIYNKVKKNEINLNILWKLLDILKKIENYELDQHSGSYEVGKLLKEIYIDGALKKEKKLNKNENENERKITNNLLSWKEYKKLLSKK